jgi:hypothetical protein
MRQLRLDKIFLRPYSTNTRRAAVRIIRLAGKGFDGLPLHFRLLSVPLLSELHCAGVLEGLDSDGTNQKA